MSSSVDRRTVLKALGLGTSLPVLHGLTGEAAAARHARAESSSEDRHGAPALRTLDPHQDATVTRICELIIPETDTPGAAAARVNEFVDVMLTEWFPPAGRRRFLKGLAKLDKRSTRTHGRRFVDCTASEQNALLAALEEQAIARRGGRPFAVGDGEILARARFFDVCKWLTLVGYYTSEIGMRQELGLRVIPGRYEPCLEV